MYYNPGKHHRRSIRLKAYNYAQAGLYFVTICCRDRANLFGTIKNGEMRMNEYGKIAHYEWLHTEKIRSNCRIHHFIIMPNHIHGIIEITDNKGKENESGEFKSPSQTIGAIIRGYKIATIKRIKEFILAKENKKAGECWGELQFAPTEFAPTEFAPTEKIKSFDFKIWQRNYYEHIIRNKASYQRISEYIINNPQNWGKDKLR